MNKDTLVQKFFKGFTFGVAIIMLLGAYGSGGLLIAVIIGIALIEYV